MAEAAEKITQVTSNDNMAIIAGRIDQVRMHEGRHYHDIQLPAPDAYSSPGWVEVQSPIPLGQPGSEWKGKCRIGGYRRTFQIKQGPRAGQQGHSINSYYIYDPK